VFKGYAVDLRITPPDVGIPMLQIKIEVMAVEHNSLAE
jgi:hypothetical protein